jgi:predicted nucleotidyltransferase
MSIAPIGLLEIVVEVCVAAGVDYAVIGAIARNAWAPPRATADVDIAVAVSPEQYRGLVTALERRGFTVKRVSAADSGDLVPDLVLLEAPPGPVRRVDLLVAKTAFEMEAIQNSIEIEIGFPCNVASPEHLVVYKLIAGRRRDLDDIIEVIKTRILAGRPVDLTLVRKWATEWKVEDRLDAALRQIPRD